jgi:preprotein translocase subunit SecY
MLKYLRQIWHSKDLRNKIIFTLLMVLLYRVMTHITIPGVNKEALQYVFDRNSLLGAFSMLTGGSAENFSIVLMGLSPYINASIIMQLLTVIIPKLEELSKEGESGRKKINKWTRWATFPLAFVQSYGMIALINAQASVPIIDNIGDPLVILPIMLIISAGTVLLMWIGEVMTEKGIGNGISILILASILAAVPPMLGPSFALAQNETERLIPMVAIMLITLILTLVVVLFTEGQRRIPITYAGRKVKAKAQQSFLPIRVNQAGMIPIIFAVSLVTFPSIIGQFLLYAQAPWVQSIGRFTTTQFTPTSWLYILAYFLLVIAFTYFYVSITFNTEQVAEDIQKRGGFIPGLRPGKETSDYLSKVSNRMNLFGGSMIGGIAVLPLALQILFTELGVSGVPLVVGGAGIIIVVGVVLDIVRRINSQLLVHHYDRFYKG